MAKIPFAETVSIAAYMEQPCIAPCSTSISIAADTNVITINRIRNEQDRQQKLQRLDKHKRGTPATQISRSYRRKWCRSLDHTNCKALRTGAKRRMVLERTRHSLTSYPLAAPAPTPQRP